MAFLEKYKAVQRTGATLLVIGRGLDEEGISLEESTEIPGKNMKFRLNRKK